jgi:hypothetical protein
VEKHIVLDVFMAKNGVDQLVRVRSQDPAQESFIAIIPRFLWDKLNEVKEGSVVLLRQLNNLRLKAVVEVLGLMPMPLQLATPAEQLEWSNPDDLLTHKQVVEILEVMQAQMLRVMSLLR